MWSDSVRDMRDQLAHLVYRGFVVRTPFEHMRDVPRYLKGISVRLDRLANAGLTRDLAAMAEVRPLWNRYKLAAIETRESGGAGSALEKIRWMMEELRVSLFAQELRTPGPVSAQRVEKLWESVGK